MGDFSHCTLYGEFKIWAEIVESWKQTNNI